MKNHIIVDKKILQTNKKFSDLRNSQKEKITNLLYTHYKEANKMKLEVYEAKQYIINNTVADIENLHIWLPLSELIKYYNGKVPAFTKRRINEENCANNNKKAD